MQRRSPRAAAKFTRRLEPITLTQTEALELTRIDRGLPSHARFRKRLTGKGLVTSPVFSKCVLTPKGRASLLAHQRTSIALAALPAHLDDDWHDPRERWLEKNARPFSRAST